MANPKVELHIKDRGVITLELDQDKALKSVANFSATSPAATTTTRCFTKCHQELHGPGRRFRSRHEAKADPGADHQRSRQRPEEHRLQRGHGAHRRSALGHGAVLHQNVVDNDFLNFKAPTAQGWGLYRVRPGGAGPGRGADAIKAVPTTRKGFHDDVPRDDVVIEKAVLKHPPPGSTRGAMLRPFKGASPLARKTPATAIAGVACSAVIGLFGFKRRRSLPARRGA